jgi:hypothetical protein
MAKRSGKSTNGSKIERILAKLTDAVGKDDYFERANAATEELAETTTAFDAVEPILQLMERNEDADFGMPGPLVHFVETFYREGYEEKLLESIERKPTPHTLWMLNRLINGAEGKEKMQLVAVMRAVAKRTDISEESRNMAQGFLKRT